MHLKLRFHFRGAICHKTFEMVFLSPYLAKCLFHHGAHFSDQFWKIDFKWKILSFKCILLWFNYFWLLMFKIISPAFLAAFTLLFAMKPLVPSCVSQTMHLVHQTQRLFYFFKLFIDVSTVIRKIFVDMLVKFMFWFLLELGNLFWLASMQFSCWAERSSLPSFGG